MNDTKNKKKGEEIHEISAERLYRLDESRQYPRCEIKGGHAYFYKKDWDYDWDKYPDKLAYEIKPPDKYRFLGYSDTKYAFKILCKGEDCRFVHEN